jgi:Holliday junction resolvase RusA-like endonuclease
VPAKKLLAWKAASGREMLLQKPESISGPVTVDLTVKRPNERSDLDNLIKAALDLLVEHRIIQDDRFVEAVKASWGCITCRSR